ncbi:MAG: metal ABC transporter solute-binding protein, Zn/Mn family [Chloroflexota bacterium]
MGERHRIPAHMLQRQRRLMALIALLIAVAVLSCAMPGGGSDQIGVVVSIAPVGDFARQVAGERARVTVMVPPGSSPHTYEPTARQMAAVSEAAVYFKVGSGVEFETMWLDELIEENPGMLVVDLSEDVELLGADPHVWMSPVNAAIMVEKICDGMVEVDSGGSAFYRGNRDDYLTELAVLDGYVRCAFEGFANRHFLIYHPAFTYFAAEYGLTQLAVEQGGKEPTPRVIEDCIEKALQYDLDYVFVAPQFASDDCETIAREIGGQTAVMDPLPENYIAGMGRTVDALVLEFED